MIKSMTGFGRGIYSNEGKEYLVEIRTVNHRYLDTSIKISRAYGFLEGKVREHITKNIVRGKVDVSIWIEDYGTSGRSIFLDEGLADMYFNSLLKLKEKYDINDSISLQLIARFPDILRVKREEEDENAIWKDLSEALNTAVESLVKMREKEGIQLKADIIKKAENIEKKINDIENRAPLVVTEYKNKLQIRIKDMLGTEMKIDEGRLEQEVAYFSDRCSIDEEITRLRSHIKQLINTTNNDSGIGRKLDFLVQEMNREINTIGSKANDLEITKNVVDIKSEIEKVREQIQNIE